VENIKDAGQGLTFDGVGAHHQNGIAKRQIRELQELARTMMIHDHRRWSECITAHIWPYTVMNENNVLNEAPILQDKQTRGALQVLSSTKVAINIKHYIPFGCLVYVLDANLQSGLPHHKWRQRSRMGIYLDRSPHHSRNVSLVLDRNTGVVSPQFHIKCDHCFHMVKEDDCDSMWQYKTGFISAAEHAEGRSKMCGLSDGSVLVASDGERNARRKKRARPEDDGQVDQQPDLPQPHVYNPVNVNGGECGDASTESHSAPQGEIDIEPQPAIEAEIDAGIVDKHPMSRSGRKRQRVQRLITVMTAEIAQCTKKDVGVEIFCLESLYPNCQGANEALQAFKATSDPDTMYLHEATKEPDAPQFIEAMVREVTDQMGNKKNSIMLRKDVPKGASILPAVWQMKRKRNIKTQAIKKWKARLNIDGSRMKAGVHYDETYAPVASWNSVRMLLAMSAMNNWCTKQIDYVLAYPQSPVENTLYMVIPKGFEL
jgi:hypothetical protein